MHLLYCQPRTGRHSCIGALPTGFIISRHIKWNHMKSHRILSHHITSKANHLKANHVISHHIASNRIICNQLKLQQLTSYRIISHYIKLHHTASYHIISIISYQIKWHHITSYGIKSHNITSNDTVSKQTTSNNHQITSYRIKWHHIASYHIKSNHIISHHGTPSHLTNLKKYCKVRMSCVWAMKWSPQPLGWRCKAQSSQRPGIWSSIWNSNIGTPTMEFQSRRSPTRSDKYPQISNNEVNRCLATSGDLCCLCCSKVKAGSCLGHLKPGSRTEAL